MATVLHRGCSDRDEDITMVETLEPESQSVITEAREIYNRVNDADQHKIDIELSVFVKTYDKWSDPEWSMDEILRNKVREYIQRYCTLEGNSQFRPSAGVKGMLLSWIKERFAQLREEAKVPH